MTTELEIHEKAKKIPEMSEQEYEELKADIKKNGQYEPIRTYKGEIVDGRHRYRACMELGVTPRHQELLIMDDEMVTDYIFSQNLRRRNLTSSQAATVAIKFGIEALFAKEAKKRQGERTDLKSNIEEEAPQSSRAREHAAKIVGTNARYISDAKKINKVDPELFERVFRGEITIPEVMKEVRKKNKRPPRQITPTQKWNRFANDYEKLANRMGNNPGITSAISKEAWAKIQSAANKINDYINQIAKEVQL